MKKNILYIGVSAIAGLLLGYFVFGMKADTIQEKAHEHTTETSGHSWTCAMHPQVMQQEEGDCPICGMDLIPVETIIEEGLSVDQFRMTENAMALANIETSIVGSDSKNATSLKLSGKIKENEEALAVQVTHFSGRIEKLLVNTVGEKVNKGQTIAMIYAPELVTAQQELLTASGLKKSQPELYQAVRNKLKLRKISEDQINQIESSGVIKETVPIHSHVSGIVSEKMVEEGNHIMKGEVLLKVVNLNTVWAEFDLYENQISLVKIGQKIQVKVQAYPDKKFEAEISFIDPVLNTTTRTVSVRAVLKNDHAFFKPGMFVEGIIPIANQSLKKHISIPKTAVLWTGERSVVYVKVTKDQPIFEMRDVLLGDAYRDSFLIKEGLSYGDEVVTNGAFTVDAAAQLQGKKSMMRSKESKEALNITKETYNVYTTDHFQKIVEEVLASYFQLKNALVADDPDKTIVFANEMLDEMNTLDKTGMDTEEQVYVETSIASLKKIGKEVNLVNQRNHFLVLNENLITLIENITHLRDITNPLYVQKCPMANNNKGAIWLSQDTEIRNPYFGSEMLACGSIISVLE